MSQVMDDNIISNDIEGVESDGNTSFLRAARNGQLEKVLEHLKTNIDINTSNANGLNALHLASKDGHVEIVEELLKRGAIVDAATKKGNTALHIASLAGQEEVVKLLVQHGASVNVQSQNGFTPLYMAAQENHDNVVKYLLANGANQSLSTEDGFTPLAVAMQQGHDKVVTVLLENDTRGKVRLPALHIAAKKDDVRAAKLLLENDHNPDVTSKSGFTPLHIASHYGNQPIANLLIQKGADVNYSAKHNITPLHVAAKWGKSNMVTLLLEQGAHIEAKTRDGLTPLHCAARSGHEQVVDMLLEKSAPISSKTKNGLAPLHMAAQGDHVDAARILLYHRAPVDEVTVDYLTALHVAAHCGHVRVAKLLLDRQADANARALNGFTPLHIACKKNRIKVVELLLKHGACIGATTESGLTPLHVASFMGCMNIVIYLLQHDASPDIPTVRGETPLHLAARANQTDIIRILLRNGAQVDARAREHQTPLHIASRLGNVDIVMLLLQHGAKVDNTTKDMYTALHISAKEGQDEVAGVLIENGASLNATTKKGFTPLHLAAKYGHLKVAKLLLQKEAPVDAQGKNGVTPLHVASHYDHQNVALLLLDKGASPHANAKNGHTPLHIAARKNQMDIAHTLLEYGAQPDAESRAGFTPLHLSSQEGHADISALLLEHKATPSHQSKNGLTPMHLCAQENKVSVAEILHKNGGDIDASTKGGYTPLHIACHYGQADMVKFLLSKGANVKSTTSIGYTPLHQAAQQGHTNIVDILLENSAQPNAITNNGQTPLDIAEKLGYITVIDTLKQVTEPHQTSSTSEEKYRVVAPEAMHETFLSDSEEEGEDTLLGDQTYRYLTADEMKSLGDDSLPIDVTRDERIDSNKMVGSEDPNSYPPRHIEDSISPEHIHPNYVEYIKKAVDNVDVSKHPVNIGFLVSFLVDARGGAMRGCRHSGVRVIVPPRSAPSPTRITCRYVRPQRTPHPPPLMEGEALASRVLELGPVGAKFLGPVIIEVPHFAALRGKEREIVILRSDNGESWKEHTVEAAEDVLNEVLRDSFDTEDLNQMEDTSSGRITRIITQDFPQYFAVISRIRQEVHAIGPEGGMVSSTVVPQVQAVFPQGALTKKIKVGLQAQPIDPELTAKLLGHGVAVSPVVTVEPRRRKFHKAITLSMPAPRAHSQGMINQYSGSAPTLRLLCSITGGTSRAQWEDVTGSTPLTFVNDCVSFTTTVSARFWLMDCRNIGDATKMATELYREAIHVPFISKFVVFAKRVDPLEARLRVFCMTDDKEEKTLEYQEQFTEIAKSRDVEVLEGKSQYIEFAGNLVPITKSGEQLQFSFRAFKENRLPFSVRVKDQHAEAVSRCLFMREPKVQKGEPPQQPICILNIVLPDDIVSETISLTDSDSIRKKFYANEHFDYYRQDPRLADISNHLGNSWVELANQLGLTSSEINVIKSEYPDSVAKQAQSMLRMWLSQSGNRAQTSTLDNALRRIGREDIVNQCLNVDNSSHHILRIGTDEINKQRLISIERSSPTRYQTDYSKDFKDTPDTFDKYSAEEKTFEPSDEEEDFNKTVPERREQIVKRLSVERTIPASSQRVEIVQEISSIKRQSLVEDKLAEVQQKTSAEPMKIIAPKTVSKQVVQEKIIVADGSDLSHVKSLGAPSAPSSQEIGRESKKSPPEKSEADRRDSVLLEEVTHLLESKKPVPKLIAGEDPKSPKFSKTPPPSPADFTMKEKQATTANEWVAIKEDLIDEPIVQQETITEELKDTACKQLTEDTPNLPTNIHTPQPKPRQPKSSELSNDNISDSVQHIKQISPVRDDLLDEQDQIEVSYQEKKKFWETITQEPVNKSSEITDKRRKSIQETPTPRPRALQSSFSVVETKHEETSLIQKDSSDIKLPTKTVLIQDTEDIPKTEYQAQFVYLPEKVQHTLESHTTVENITHVENKDSEQKDSSDDQLSNDDSIPNKNLIGKQDKAFAETTSKAPDPQILKSDSTDSETANSSQGGDNAGYISDSGDVEQYISDSEIEDRVPQIRERQMSVFVPASVSQKTRFERSASLPTEDLYEVSARSTKLRKEYYEQQIKKEMIKEQLTIELEDDGSPERKSIDDIMETSELILERTCAPELIDTNAEIIDSKHIADNSSQLQDVTSQKPVQDVKLHEKTDFTNIVEIENKVGDYTCIKEDIELHVDKSETERSEKGSDHKDQQFNIPDESLSESTAGQSNIPQIVFSLSGKQRLSEDSDDYYDNQQETSSNRKQQQRTSSGEMPVTSESDEIQLTDAKKDSSEIDLTRNRAKESARSPDSRKIKFKYDTDIEKVDKDPKKTTTNESEAPTTIVNQPKENVTSMLWEVTTQSESLKEEEFNNLPSIISCEQDQILPDQEVSKDEHHTTSELQEDKSESTSSDRIKSDSHSDMKRIILDSLHQQKIDPQEAKKIANSLIEEIESEIQKVETFNKDLKSRSDSLDQEKQYVTSYLKELAEAKGLDQREVELVESILERRQRQISKLGRADTQASSMEITDEDLRYSEGELEYSNVLQQQMGQLEAENSDHSKDVYESLVHLDQSKTIKTTNKIPEESDDQNVISKKKEKQIKVNDVVSLDKYKQTKDIIIEEDENATDCMTEIAQKVEESAQKIHPHEVVEDDRDTNIGSQTKTNKIILSSECEEQTTKSSQVEKTITKLPSNEADDSANEKMKRTSSSDSKSSIGSGKSPEELFSTCSSDKKIDSDPSQDIIMRKSRTDHSSSLKQDHKSGTEIENYSSSGESHYHSFEIDNKSRPCSSDLEGIIPTGSSEYESALNSQELSSRSQHTSGEYHTAVSSLSSKDSMRSFESESSGNLASIEVSEASETLVPTNSDLEGELDIVDQSGLDETELLWQTNAEDGPIETLSTSNIIDSTSDLDQIPDVPLKMKRSYEMTFQPEPRVLSADSPHTESNDIEEKFGTSIDEGSIISVSLSSTSSAQPRTVIELSRTESGNLEESFTSILSDHISLDDNDSTTKNTETTLAHMSTSTNIAPKEPIESVTILSSSFTESGTSNACTQVTTETTQSVSDPVKFNHDELRKKGHRRQESNTFIPPLMHAVTKSAETKGNELLEGQDKEDSKESRIRLENSQDKHVDLSIKYEHSERRDSHGKSSSTSSEKSSFEEAEAEAAFNMVAHISPVHKIKQICPIIEDVDAEKSELEAKERAEKERALRASKIRDSSPGSIPDIKVTEHMAPLDESNFRYPELEMERDELEQMTKITSEFETAAPIDSSVEQEHRKCDLEDPNETNEISKSTNEKIKDASYTSTVMEKTSNEEERKTDSPNSDSFELIEKPDIIDDFVVIEEVGKEAHEMDSEGKSVTIQGKPSRSKKADSEIDAYLAKSDPTPLTKLTELRYFPEGSSNDELEFEFEDSPPQQQKNNERSSDYGLKYDMELEANRKWIEQQFHGDQAAMAAAGYGYEMEFERGPLEDIKEEDINDMDLASSRIGSLGSQKESGGSLGSVKDSYSSTPEYDVLAGRRYFTKSGEHDDISMSSLQEFENLERAMSLESKKFHHGSGSQDSSSNGSFKTRYYAHKGQGDDISVSSLKEFEGLEKACIAAHKTEVRVKEEEALLSQIEKLQESIPVEHGEKSDFDKTTNKKVESDEEDYEKRMFEIDEIIKQAQTNVERFVDLKETDKTESLGRGESVEEVSKVPELELDVPLGKPQTIQNQTEWNEDDAMVTSTDSLELSKDKRGHYDSIDSLDQKNDKRDVMTASTDSIEFNNQLSRDNITSDSIDTRAEGSHMVCSDSLEIAAAAQQKLQTDSLEEDEQKIFHDHSSSDTGKDFSSSVKDDPAEHDEQLHELMLGSTDSLDPTSSTATHATYQYETDSVFSGSFTSGGSNTMVSSTDTIDPTHSKGAVDISAAVRKVWFDEHPDASKSDINIEYFGETSMPYVTEVIEPSEDQGFSHTIIRRVEMPAEINKITFTGQDANERMKQFMNDFREGEDVQETEEIDAAGNIHTRRVVQKRYIISSSDKEGESSKHQASEKSSSEHRSEMPTSQLTAFSKSLTGQPAQAESGSHEAGLKDHPEASSSERPEDLLRHQPHDQQQLSDEMRELLKEMEKASRE